MSHLEKLLLIIITFLPIKTIATQFSIFMRWTFWWEWNCSGQVCKNIGDIQNFYYISFSYFSINYGTNIIGYLSKILEKYQFYCNNLFPSDITWVYRHIFPFLLTLTSTNDSSSFNIIQSIYKIPFLLQNIFSSQLIFSELIQRETRRLKTTNICMNWITVSEIKIKIY